MKRPATAKKERAAAATNVKKEKLASHLSQSERRLHTLNY
jgi:hypothetical protein